MREIYFNSDITPKAEREIKLLALYYDKINIVNYAVYTPTFDTSDGKFEFAGSQALEFISKSFRQDYKTLISEGIITITKKEDDLENDYDKLFPSRISTILNANKDIIFPKHPVESDGRIITQEVYHIMKYMMDFEWGMPIQENYVWWYYALKLKWFLKLLIEGKNCISSSNNLNALFAKFMDESTKTNQTMGTKGYTKSLAFDALKFSLPNPDVLSFENILELKLKLKDELGLFTQTINSIEVRNKELFNTDIKDHEYQALFFSEIQKPLSDLELKMKTLKSKAFRTFVDKLQNPNSYAPLIGTVVASVPIQYTILASLGINSLQSYWEYAESKREVANNGLYFLLKIR